MYTVIHSVHRAGWTYNIEFYGDKHAQMYTSIHKQYYKGYTGIHKQYYKGYTGIHKQYYKGYTGTQVHRYMQEEYNVYRYN
jgi:hypothetical protein